MKEKGCLKPITFLVADDDDDDKVLIKEAIEHACGCYNLRFVGDGLELLEYLHRKGTHADATLSPYPDLIILDLNMPRKDGLEALNDIKSDPDLMLIPIIIFTTTREEEIVAQGYGRGANTFIPKPVTFEHLTRVMRSISQYWCHVATLPPSGGKRGLQQVA